MKRLIIAIVLIIVALIVGGGYAFLQAQQPSVGPLNGYKVSPSVAERRPIAITIDNFAPDARPQSGISQASLVYETLAEGGITRLMAVFLEHDSAMVGPIRSTRIYFNHLAAGLGVILGHDGGNRDAQRELPSDSTIYNEDSDYNHQPFWRTSTRAIPHNEYTSTYKLRAYAKAHGGSITGSRVTLPHKDDAALGQRPTNPIVLHVDFSYTDYNIEWSYDRATNTYLRYANGIPQTDASTGKQLSADNVVVMYTHERPDPDPYTPGSIYLDTEGSNKVTVYQDGKAMNGTWSKSDKDAPLRWLNSSGNQIPLNRGDTWVDLVPLGTPVSVNGTL
ncbi:MAG: DUF3048 domain-containing protein [Rhodanobacteraceae bacterium]